MRFWHLLNRSSIGLYSTMLTLLMMGDGVMSYMMPVMIEEHVHNQFFMGLILAFSSIIGLMCDFVFSRWLRGGRFTVLVRRTLAMAVLFPVVLLLFGQNSWVFLLAMAIWGVYYELAMFSNYHFIDGSVPLEKQPDVWGFINSIWSVAWFVAPILATLLYDKTENGPLVLALGLYVGSLLLFLTNRQRFEAPKKTVAQPDEIAQINQLQEFKVWWVLLRKLWPVYFFNLMAILLMSGFWSVGALLAEELEAGQQWGMLFFAAWTAPPLVFSAVSGPITHRFRKKKTAFVAGLISGLLLLPLIWVQYFPLMVLLTFLSSAFYSISYPGLESAIQEYVSKLGPIGNDLVGLQNSAASFGYIIGPILAGALASGFGNQASLGILGGLFATMGLIGVLVVRKEIRLPHEALHAIFTEKESN